jgi:hypothetical protein
MSFMKKSDPAIIVRQFNECINNQDLVGLTKLMTDDHTFIDRDGTKTITKKAMTQNWRNFFSMVPDYKNTFIKIESTKNMVTIIGYAFWSKGQPLDHVIWTAKISDNLIKEWRIYKDTEQIRHTLNLI